MVPLIAAYCSMGGSCGSDGCPPVDMSGPMTQARASEIAPDVSTGLALSTTFVFGDCRATELGEGEATCATVANPACKRQREGLRVLVVPVNVSVAHAPGCGGARASDVAAVAIVDQPASDSGEIVITLPPGGYVVHLARQGESEGCTACGADVGGCLVEVPEPGVAVRDVVLDRATR